MSERIPEPQNPEFVPLGVTTVERVIAERFNDPLLWSKPSQSSAPLASINGLTREALTGEFDTQLDLNRVWTALAYGVRPMVCHDEWSPTGDIHIGRTDTAMLPVLGMAIAETIMRDESVRPARLMVAADPHGGLGSSANNDRWLQYIHDGYWPITEYQQSHDTSGEHLANLLFGPRELQGLITDIAACALEQRMSPDERMVGKVQYMPGEDRNPDKYRAYQTSYIHADGVGIMDRVTDTQAYMAVLADLVDYDGDMRQRFAEINRDESEWSADLYDLQQVNRSMKLALAEAHSFVTRHRENRISTQQEIDVFLADMYEGTARVASKIKGQSEVQRTRRQMSAPRRGWLGRLASWRPGR